MNRNYFVNLAICVVYFPPCKTNTYLLLYLLINLKLSRRGLILHIQILFNRTQRKRDKIMVHTYLHLSYCIVFSSHLHKYAYFR